MQTSNLESNHATKTIFVRTIKAGGVFGCISSGLAYYVGASMLWHAEKKYKDRADEWADWLPLGMKAKRH
jgi:hypothetical protein